MPRRYHCPVTWMVTVVLISWMGLSVLLGVLLAGMIRAEETRIDGLRDGGPRPGQAGPAGCRAPAGARVRAH